MKLLSTITILILATASAALATPTPAQRCEADVELASAKYAQCRLTAEAKYSKSLDADKRTSALARCSDKLQQSFAKAIVRYGLNCTSVSVVDLDAYLKQCSDDVAAASVLGGTLPDDNGDLAICNASLSACTEDLAACQVAPQALLLKTGQTSGPTTTDYGPGSDGDLQFGVAQSYVDNGDGTITDTKTGLVWEKKSDDDTIHDKDNFYTWSASGSQNTTGTVFTAFLATLNSGAGFAGHTDWRLPNRREMESLVNLGPVSDAISPAFNTGCGGGCTVLTCSCTIGSVHWTSSSRGEDAWVVDFTTGFVFLGNKTSGYFVRAVRGGVVG